MKTGTVIRTRVVALFAMLLMFFGMTGGLPGLDTAEGGATPFVVSAMASNGMGVNNMFSDIGEEAGEAGAVLKQIFRENPEKILFSHIKSRRSSLPLRLFS